MFLRHAIPLAMLLSGCEWVPLGGMEPDETTGDPTIEIDGVTIETYPRGIQGYFRLDSIGDQSPSSYQWECSVLVIQEARWKAREHRERWGRSLQVHGERYSSGSWGLSYHHGSYLATPDSAHWSGAESSHVSFATKVTVDTLVLKSDVNLFRQRRPYYARWIFQRLPRDEDFDEQVWINRLRSCLFSS